MNWAYEMMGMVTAVYVPPFFVHILELGHKSSYFQNTSRQDPCPLPESVSFIQQNITNIGAKSLLDSERQRLFNFPFCYNT